MIIWVILRRIVTCLLFAVFIGGVFLNADHWVCGEANGQNAAGGEGVTLPGTGQRATASIQREINAAGASGGCHLCGTTNPGTASGKWVLDHIPPTKLADGQPQLGFPSCINCSQIQGGYVSAAAKGAAGAAGIAASGNANASSSGILGSEVTWGDVGNFLIDSIVPGGVSGVGAGSDIVPRAPNTSYGPLQSGYGSTAGGGFLLYPNKANTNMMQSVYSR